MQTNGIIGDAYGTELPQTQMPEELLVEEKAMARFSKSKEFAHLKKHIEDRIRYYQAFLPNGKTVVEGATAEDWRVANVIIGEFQAVIDAYERAREIVNESK